MSKKLREFGVFFEVGLALFQEGFAAFLGFVEEVVEHGAVAGEFLDTSLTVEFGIQIISAHSTHSSSRRSMGTTLFTIPISSASLAEYWRQRNQISRAFF